MIAACSRMFYILFLFSQIVFPMPLPASGEPRGDAKRPVRDPRPAQRFFSDKRPFSTCPSARFVAEFFPPRVIRIGNPSARAVSAVRPVYAKIRPDRQRQAIAAWPGNNVAGPYRDSWPCPLAAGRKSCNSRPLWRGCQALSRRALRAGFWLRAFFRGKSYVQNRFHQKQDAGAPLCGA